MKKKLPALGAVILLLALAFWYGGGAPGLQGWRTEPPAPVSPVSRLPQDAPASPEEPEPPQDPASAPEAPDLQEERSAPDAGARGDAPQAAPEPPAAAAQPQGETPLPAQEPEEPPAQPDACTLSIRCGAVLDHMDWLDPDKAGLIPADGVILAETQADIQEGESAFSLLQRLTRQAGIPMEASFTPGYNSSYVEGIANLYEFDCGQQSGWVYLVNGTSPGCSSSQYLLSPGDTVEWVYTCDLGADVGAVP